MKHIKYTVIILAAVGLYIPLLGEEKMQAGFIPASAVLRSSSPVCGEMQLLKTGKKIHEGSIIVSLTDSSHDLLYTYVFGPVAIAEEQKRIRMMLPAVPTAYNPSLQMKIEFEYLSGTRTRLSVSPLNTGSAEHVFTAAFCLPEYVESRSRSCFLSNIRLEYLGSGRGSGAGRMYRQFFTGTHIFSSEEMPADPYFYCGFDMIVLYGAVLGQLRIKQLEAIETWVKAGGSLCVVPGKSLPDGHVSFLNRICRSTGTGPFAKNRSGNLVFAESSDAGYGTYYSCLGRTAVIVNRERFSPQWNSMEWKRIVCFLWKVRKKKQKNLLEHKKWSEESKAFSFSVKELNSQDVLRYLFPEKIRVIPAWMIVLILVALVLLIGPVDYIVLGWIKKRKYTWLFFPGVCIGVGIFMILISQWYMGTAANAGSIEITDVDSKGRIIRQSRYDLWFPSKNMATEQEIDSGILSRMDFGKYYSDYFYRYGYRSAYYSGKYSDSGPIRITGRFPNRYTARSALRKWTPRIQRSFMFGEGQKAENLSRDEYGLLTGDASLFTSMAGLRKRCRSLQSSVFLWQNGTFRPLSDRGDYKIDRIWLAELCSRRSVIIRGEQIYQSENGLFSNIFQISPNGGEGFADLALADPDSDSHIVVVVVKREGRNTLIFRRMIIREQAWHL